MNILSYIFNFETTNLLINQIIDNIKKKVISGTTQFMVNFSSNRYIGVSIDI